MTYLSRMLYAGLYITLITPVIIAVFTFFNIPFETYANYLLWMIALGIFFSILPLSKQNIFSSNYNGK